MQRNIAAVSNTINSIQDFVNNDPKTLATFRALHAFPIPPFPNGDPQMSALSDTIFSKEPGNKEQDWIRAKLTNAAEFAHVPGDWGIEAKRPAEEHEDETQTQEERNPRRQRAYLDEDQLAALWNDVYDLVEEQATVAQNALNEEASGDEDEDEGEDEEMDGVEGAGGPSPTSAAASKPMEKEVPMMSLNTIHKFMSTGTTL